MKKQYVVMEVGGRGTVPLWSFDSLDSAAAKVTDLVQAACVEVEKNGAFWNGVSYFIHAMTTD